MVKHQGTKEEHQGTKDMVNWPWKVGTRDTERVAAAVVDACLKVHRELGPGLLESVYQTCLAYELSERGFRVERELPLPVRYGTLEIPAGFRIDMLVDDLVLIENKAVQALLSVHEAQLLTYLRMAGKQVGFLINWHVPVIRQGIKRMAISRDRRPWCLGAFLGVLVLIPVVSQVLVSRS